MVKKIETLQFIDEELKEKLLPHLENKVFHLTTIRAYDQIIADNEIKNNKDNVLTPYKKPDHSFGSKKGWVCLFNLKGVAREEIDEILSRSYNFLDPSFHRGELINDKQESNLVYFILADNCHDMIIENACAKGTLDHCVEKIECWINEKIPLDYIAKILKVKITRSVPKGSHTHLTLSAMQQNKTNNR